LKDTSAKRARKDKEREKSEGRSSAAGPGVFEHRTAPRLEWLGDLGALTKQGLPKNGFSYFVTPDAKVLLDSIDQHLSTDDWPDEAALRYWRNASLWESWRRALPAMDLRRAILRGYRLMERAIGPAPIREVCFGAAVLAPHDSWTLASAA